MKTLISVAVICLLSFKAHAEYSCDDLVEAARSGELSIVKQLLQKGCNVDTHPTVANPHFDFGTPLFVAIGSGHTDVALFLIQKDANVNYVARDFNVTPLAHAAKNPVACSVVEALLKKGANPNTTVNSGSMPITPLMLAVMSQSRCKVEALIKTKEVDVNRRTEADGPTALHFAAWNGDVSIIKVLIKAGADPTINDSRSGTPSAGAISQGHMEAFRLLQLYEKR